MTITATSKEPDHQNETCHLIVAAPGEISARKASSSDAVAGEHDGAPAVVEGADRVPQDVTGLDVSARVRGCAGNPDGGEPLLIRRR